jgi:tetratricopeptide (TPR) repeat protein
MVLAGLAFVCSCSEVRGRRLLQKANQLYRDGQYREAVATFEQAERFVPDMWLLWLNKGYTCRGMLIPGARTPENQAVLKCALEAFKRLQELKPEDHRGPALYVQTLFEADQFETLAGMYQQRFQKNPQDVEALQGLIQVYSKWPKHLDEALQWHRKKVELLPGDAEAHYSAAVFIWQQLFTRGGGADRASFDPRPDPNKPKRVKVPPAMASDDLVGQQRVDLADEGIKLLEKAVALRPKYQEAMAYVNLLYRQKSYAYFDQPDEWQKAVDKATEWRNRTLLTMGKPIPKPGAPLPASGEQ